mgnify:CR=1 FL=1
MIITIPNYRCPSRNKTYHAHWRVAKNNTDEILELVKAYCKPPKKPFEKFAVYIIAYYKGKRHVDPSNIPAKEIIDGLRYAGVIKDDDAYHQKLLTVQVIPEIGEDCLSIEVIEL